MPGRARLLERREEPVGVREPLDLPGATFYETFHAGWAQRLVRSVESVCAPVRGFGLNTVEIGLPDDREHSHEAAQAVSLGRARRRASVAAYVSVHKVWLLLGRALPPFRDGPLAAIH